jgi:hypothetical protein
MSTIYECVLNANKTFKCFIFPRSKFPQGLWLDYDSCPDVFDNQTGRLVSDLCIGKIMIDKVVQNSIYYQIQSWLRYYCSTVLVAPAVLFNLLSFLVLLSFQKSRSSTKTSTTFYMICLSIFDILAIVSKFLYEIIIVQNGLRERPLVINSIMCKMISFSESFFMITSIYLLIAMTIDKLLCVVVPLKVAALLTPNKAKIVISLLLFLAAVVSSYNLFDKKVEEVSYGCVSNWHDLEGLFINK